MKLGDGVTNNRATRFLGYDKGLRFTGVVVHAFTCKAEPVIIMGINQYKNNSLLSCWGFMGYLAACSHKHLQLCDEVATVSFYVYPSTDTIFFSKCL